MPLTIDQLHPYQSLLLLRTRSGKSTKSGFLTAALEDIEELVSEEGDRAIQDRFPMKSIRGLKIIGLHYIHERVPPWTSNPDIIDRLNCLVLVIQRGAFVVIHTSEPRLRARVMTGTENVSYTALSTLELIPSATLNAAFIKGDTKTLWLSGTHRHVRWKADTKVLTGIDLRDALDPIEDQTFHFTAARCSTELRTGRNVVMGITPRRAQIWIGISNELDEFLKNVDDILRAVEATVAPVLAPLPILAIPSSDLTRVSDAYDIAVIPNELSEDIEADTSAKQLHESLARSLTFEITTASGADATAEVYLEDRLLGTMNFNLTAGKAGTVRLSVTGTAFDDSVRDDFKDTLIFCNARGHIKIWFQSGHTFADDSIFEGRFRDIPFQVQFADFAGFNVRKEKPEKGCSIGQDDSLFCWVLNKWAVDRRKHSSTYMQWLGCDDGAHEKADFVCLELIDGEPHLTLLHVKSVHMRAKLGVVSAQRAISVSNYEVVVGQAVKNIRWLDRLAAQNGSDADPKRLDEKLAGTIKHAWKDGTPIHPDTFKAALRDQLKIPYGTEVTVIQPQATDFAVQQATKNGGLNLLRLRQLYTLLNQGKAAAANVGAKFTVIGERVAARLPASTLLKSP